MTPSAPHTRHQRIEVMGTVVAVDLYGDSPLAVPEVDAAIAEAEAVLHRADRTFSTWRFDSPINRLRRGEIALGEAPSEVADVLDSCRLAKEISGGWFDPWAMPGGVDPTGYVKGWAAACALEALRVRGVKGAMVNAAGDIASFGGVGGHPFRVGVVRPDTPSALACVVTLHGSIATSGDYLRGPHLINPFDHERSTSVASASVTGPDLALADAMATALAVGGDEVLARIERLDGYEALTIGVDGVRGWTTGFAFADVLNHHHRCNRVSSSESTHAALLTELFAPTSAGVPFRVSSPAAE